MFRRTRWQLVGWNLLVLAVILTLFGAGVYLLTWRQLTAQVDRELRERSQATRAARHGPEDTSLTGPQGYSGGFFTLVLAPDGDIISDPQGVSLHIDPATLQPPQFLTVTVNGQPARVYIAPLPAPDGRTLLLLNGESLLPVQQALHRLLIGLLIGGIGGLGLSFLGAWFLAGRALIPIELAFRRQQEFVADASHELRTPLTVLRATADLLDQHRTTPLAANQQLWDDLRQELARLERLANDLLLLARADLNELDLAVAPVDLVVLSAETVRRVAPLAAERGLQLHFQHPDQPLEAEVDPDRFQQLLLILLDNALKYTPPPGQITVALSRHGRMAQVLVRDTGEGIAPEHLPRLFDRFYRVDRARSRHYGGAGLGLAIAHTIVTAHQGTIRIESAPAKGTTVTVELPLGNTLTPERVQGRVDTSLRHQSADPPSAHQG